MKDSNIFISVKRKKTELISFLICFVVANLVNLYAIIAYDTSFKELYTQLGYIILFTIALYVVWSLLRIAFHFIKKMVALFSTSKKGK